MSYVRRSFRPRTNGIAAIERAGSIFGVAVSPLLNSSNVSSLVTGVRKKVSDGRTTCQSYCQKLRDRFEKLGLPLADSDRLKTATATLRILEKLHLSADGAVVGALASAEVATSESAMGECLNKAGTLAATLDGTNWEIFEAIAGLTDERKTAANAIRSAVEQALRCDEHVKPLAGTLEGGPVEGGAAIDGAASASRPPSAATSAPTPRPKVDRSGNGGVPAHRGRQSEA